MGESCPDREKQEEVAQLLKQHPETVDMAVSVAATCL